MTEQGRAETVRPPSLETLRKYGLAAEEWLTILASQGNVCAVCKRVPKSGRWVTDHHHVAQWKTMPPERRRLYVRGIICPFCNSHCVGRFMTLEKARNIVVYLEQHSLNLNERGQKALSLFGDDLCQK